MDEPVFRRPALGEHEEARVILAGIDVIQSAFMREHLSGNLAGATEIYNEVASMHQHMQVSLGLIPEGAARPSAREPGR